MKGLCIGSEQDIRNNSDGYVAFVRQGTDEAIIFQQYINIVLLPHFQRVREAQGLYTVSNMEVPEEHTVVSWSDGGLPQLKNTLSASIQEVWVLESNFEPTGIPDHEDVDQGTEAESRQRCKTLNHEWHNVKRKRAEERLLEKRREKELMKQASIADFIEMNRKCEVLLKVILVGRSVNQRLRRLQIMTQRDASTSIPFPALKSLKRSILKNILKQDLKEGKKLLSNC